ncbi:MAG: SPOR domain-containing protein [Prevotella sp.]|nr:SPOR domain-containing protein [Prevotella sp.]
MKRFAALLFFVLTIVMQLSAQSFLDVLRTRKSGEGVVTVNQSKDIDELVNSAKLEISSPTQTQSQQNATVNPEKKKGNTGSNNNETFADNTGKESVAIVKPEQSSSESGIVNTDKKVMRNSTTMTGYRVQVYSGGNTRDDRNNAEQIGRAVKAKFPELPIYVHFYSPRWICRVGNFKTYQEADNVLKDIKAMGYNDACIVKGKITVAN